MISDDPDDERVQITGKKRTLSTMGSPSGDPSTVHTIIGNQNTIILDERDGQEKILIEDYKGNFIKFDIKNEQLYAKFKSDMTFESGGNIYIRAAKNISLLAGGNIMNQALGMFTAYGKLGMAFESGMNMKITCPSNITMGAGGTITRDSAMIKDNTVGYTMESILDDEIDDLLSKTITASIQDNVFDDKEYMKSNLSTPRSLDGLKKELMKLKIEGQNYDILLSNESLVRIEAVATEAGLDPIIIKDSHVNNIMEKKDRVDAKMLAMDSNLTKAKNSSDINGKVSIGSGNGILEGENISDIIDIETDVADIIDPSKAVDKANSVISEVANSDMSIINDSTKSDIISKITTIKDQYQERVDSVTDITKGRVGIPTQIDDLGSTVTNIKDNVLPSVGSVESTISKADSLTSKLDSMKDSAVNYKYVDMISTSKDVDNIANSIVADTRNLDSGHLMPIKRTADTINRINKSNDTNKTGIMSSLVEGLQSSLSTAAATLNGANVLTSQFNNIKNVVQYAKDPKSITTETNKFKTDIGNLLQSRKTVNLLNNVKIPGISMPTTSFTKTSNAIKHIENVNDIIKSSTLKNSAKDVLIGNTSKVLDMFNADPRTTGSNPLDILNSSMLIDDHISTKVSNVLSSINPLKGGIKSIAMNGDGNIVKGFTNTLSNMVDDVKDVSHALLCTEDIMDGMKGLIKNNKLFQSAGNLISGIVDKASKFLKLDILKDKLSNLFTSGKTLLSNSIKKLKGIADSITGIAAPYIEGAKKLIGAVESIRESIGKINLAGLARAAADDYLNSFLDKLKNLNLTGVPGDSLGPSLPEDIDCLPKVLAFRAGQAVGSTVNMAKSVMNISSNVFNKSKTLLFGSDKSDNITSDVTTIPKELKSKVEIAKNTTIASEIASKGPTAFSNFMEMGANAVIGLKDKAGGIVKDVTSSSIVKSGMDAGSKAFDVVKDKLKYEKSKTTTAVNPNDYVASKPENVTHNDPPAKSS